ncbi:putative ATPase [Bernardetia litoralis DSM 6794]|uniref:Putative ATPase n=1 Tax=Bernardetia litoralis (strain ATCC 23117 / DSM 6794 / NBRC 15988 / NCIMB 1366 / Fx l1 / Sio-4) TaxID=880071 RepID=I4AIV4_BERLS|nr:AAA family ATPase [Bernardetia litoralis]AFM03889.1 putative ATPase [Bernardetia litoralis DSM 6794]
MEQEELEAQVKFVALSRLYLDPNNYRFIDHSDYVRVPEDKIRDNQIQKRTRNFLLGKNNENVEDLINSLKVNGYLSIDQIQVRELGKGSYLVIEGNRRIATLKYLQEKYEEEIDIGKLNPKIFSKVPIVLTRAADESHYKVLMALKHISGNKKWSAINQARLLKSLLDEGKSKEEIKDAVGISKTALNRFLRSLSLVEAYESSDYSDQFRSEKFNLFSELIKQPKIMSWLDWSNEIYEAGNKANLERLFSWISEDEKITEDGYRKSFEPIITKGDDMRELAKIIDDENLLETMETSRSISEAYLSSDVLLKDKFGNVITNLNKNINDAFNFISYADESTKNSLKEIRKKFDALLISQGLEDALPSREIQRQTLLDFSKSTHFSSITIENYKQFQDFSIKNLNRVNLIGGDNNSGKSSLLEAIYLLCIQNDIFAFIEMQRRRGKFFNNVPSNWLSNNVKQEYKINGVFFDINVDNYFHVEQEKDENFDKTDYLTTLFLKASFDNDYSESKMRLFEKDKQSYFKQINNLCHVRYSSPFSIHSREDLFRSHEKSIETKSIDKILSFIRNYVDKGIEKIDLVGEGDLQRFLVTHSEYNEAVDITHFGDGLQRIFQITLLFATVKNGVLLIDEIENAIHHDLFKNFTRFIEDLAEEFNVQLFITSHSKECINSFFDNGNKNTNLSAYSLINKNGEIELQYTEGERFARMIQNFDTDLRK